MSKAREFLAQSRNKSVPELQSELTRLREKLADLRIQHSQRKLKDVKELTKVKKQIAQVLTVIKEKNHG